MGFPGTDVYAARAAAAGIGQHVTFTGRVDYDASPQYLALGCVAVAPKLSATEGSGKVLTYMATGLPVVAFDTPVSRDYLGEDGRYAAPGNSLQLAERIAELLEDPQARAATGDRLRRRAEQRFGWLAAGERILEVYDSVARQPVKEQA
jgi:glycosyltransferase involved in cell wall biosynthesis